MNIIIPTGWKFGYRIIIIVYIGEHDEIIYYMEQTKNTKSECFKGKHLFPWITLPNVLGNIIFI